MMKLFSQLSTDISIHALLAESDRCCPCAIIAPAISIHALLAESDAAIFFLYCAFPYFYPRSPCGERRSSRRTPRTNPDFYPRSPCGERRAVPCGVGAPLKFLSTLSLRRATVFVCVICQRLAISIHALLAESDYRPGPFQLSRTEFLSTLSLRRATRSAPEQLRTVRVFLSTLSLRRATARGRDRAPAAAISIHALLAESDPSKRT